MKKLNTHQEWYDGTMRSSASAILAVIMLFELTACETENNESSFEETSSSVAIRQHTTNKTDFGLIFDHPASWGIWGITDMPSQPQTEALTEMSFSELGKAIRAPQTGNADVTMVFRKYDEGAFRFEEVCDFERSVDLCDVTKQQDLLEEKEAFIKGATHTIGGVPATVRDFYDPSSGYVAREARFYTPTHRVRTAMIYDIGDFLLKHGPDDPSLFDTAQRILGPEVADPIGRLGTMFPKELHGMTAFYAEADAFLQSITPAP